MGPLTGSGACGKGCGHNVGNSATRVGVHRTQDLWLPFPVAPGRNYSAGQIIEIISQTLFLIFKRTVCVLNCFSCIGLFVRLWLPSAHCRPPPLPLEVTLASNPTDWPWQFWSLGSMVSCRMLVFGAI